MQKRLISLVAAALLISFVAGALANPITFTGKPSPLSSGEARVPPAHLQVNSVQWIIDADSSTVGAVEVNVTNTDTVTHTFNIVIQISCASSTFRPSPFPGQFGFTPFICSGGSAIVTVSPSTGTGNSITLTIILNRAIDPEITQIDDVSFIVAETA